MLLDEDGAWVEEEVQVQQALAEPTQGSCWVPNLHCRPSSLTTSRCRLFPQVLLGRPSSRSSRLPDRRMQI